MPMHLQLFGIAEGISPVTAVKRNSGRIDPLEKQRAKQHICRPGHIEKAVICLSGCYLQNTCVSEQSVGIFKMAVTFGHRGGPFSLLNKVYRRN